MKLKAEREEIELKGQKEHKEAQEQKVRNEKVDIYLDQICGQVKAREVHNDLREELGNHLHEIICDKEQEGYSPEQAAAYAIEQMGDPTELGKACTNFTVIVCTGDCWLESLDWLWWE